MKRALGFMVIAIIPFVLWTRTVGTGSSWKYGGIFSSEAKCLNGDWGDWIEPPPGPSAPKPPIFAICLPLGIHPKDSGLFD